MIHATYTGLTLSDQVRSNPPVWAMRALGCGACNVLGTGSVPETLIRGYRLVHAFSLWTSHLVGTSLPQRDYLDVVVLPVPVKIL